MRQVTFSYPPAPAVIIVVSRKQNSLRMLARLIAEITITISLRAQKDSLQTRALEKRCIILSDEQARLLRSRGVLGLINPLIFGALLAKGVPDGLAGSIASGSTGLFTASNEANAALVNTKSQLTQTKRQEEVNRSSSNNNVEQSLDAVLQAELRRHQTAASSGG